MAKRQFFSKKTVSSSGFTLIEVLVVTAIMSVFIINMPLTVSRLFSQKHYILQKYRASNIAWNQAMDYYQKHRRYLKTLVIESNGSKDSWGQSWRWARDSEDALAGGIMRHQFKVYEEKDNKVPIVSLVLFLQK